jgi:hypothetical protein
MMDDPYDLRHVLRGRDLRDLSARSALPIRLVEHFAAGGSISPGSLLLLVAALQRPTPHWSQTRQLVRRWLLDADNAATAAAAIGCDAKDMLHVAEGRVDLPSGQWRKVAALVWDDPQCARC